VSVTLSSQALSVIDDAKAAAGENRPPVHDQSDVLETMNELIDLLQDREGIADRLEAVEMLNASRIGQDLRRAFKMAPPPIVIQVDEP
jgi:hypothetical protein